MSNNALYAFATRIAPSLIKIGAVFSRKLAVFNESQKKAKSDQISLAAWRKGVPGKVCWIHCASLGEFEQGRPIIEALKKLENPPAVALTFFSSSGYEIRKNYPLADWVGYLPLDHPIGSSKFIEILNPSLAIFVKYEFWPFYIQHLAKAGIPFFAVSVLMRKDHFIFKNYAGYFKESLRKFTKIFVQNTDSELFLAQHQITNVSVAGDTRFDTVVKNRENAKELALVKTWAANAHILVAGSTWPADEELLLNLLSHFPSLKVILVPHEIHTEALEKIKATHNGIFYADLKPNTTSRLLIINQIGLLSSLYQYGTVAYVGGAFGKGLHNILEAATYGLPILFGNKSYEKFQEAVDLIALALAKPIASYEELANELNTLLTNSQTLAKNKIKTRAYVDEKAGATAQIMEHLKPILE